MWDTALMHLAIAFPIIVVICYFSQRAIVRQTAQLNTIVERIKTDGVAELSAINEAIARSNTTNSDGPPFRVAFGKSLFTSDEMAREINNLSDFSEQIGGDKHNLCAGCSLNFLRSCLSFCHRAAASSDAGCATIGK